ncbi:MAG: hypothetical protein K9J45_16980 [Bacteroidales bacterium]|nr:hypothetical protein [Bacteroidales bacterium]MCF8313943.1 hypothetical protein [Saprospiraceae bacterium]
MSSFPIFALGMKKVCKDKGLIIFGEKNQGDGCNCIPSNGPPSFGEAWNLSQLRFKNTKSRYLAALISNLKILYR